MQDRKTEVGDAKSDIEVISSFEEKNVKSIHLLRSGRFLSHNGSGIGDFVTATL